VTAASTWTPEQHSQISNVGDRTSSRRSRSDGHFSAEYGRNSGATSTCHPQWSNDFRGSAYEYHRNDGWTGTTSSATPAASTRLAFRYNDFGWSLGGPIQKNKCSSSRRGVEEIRRFTTPALRKRCPRERSQGDFSALATPIRDPCRAAVPRHIIPASRITPNGRAIANVYTAAEETPTLHDRAIPTTPLLGENPFDWRQDLLRLDYQASQNTA